MKTADGTERRRLGIALTERQPIGFFRTNRMPNEGAPRDSANEKGCSNTSGCIMSLSFIETRLKHAAALRKSAEVLRHPLHRFCTQKYPVVLDADFLELYTQQPAMSEARQQQLQPSALLPAFSKLRYRASNAPVDGTASLSYFRKAGSSMPWMHVPGAVPRDELTLLDDVRCVLLQLFVYGSFFWIPAVLVYIWRRHCTTRRRKVVFVVAVLSLVLYPIRPQLGLRNWKGWHKLHNYHRTAAIVERIENFPPREPTIYAVFPHGVVPTAPMTSRRGYTFRQPDPIDAAMACGYFGNLLGHFRLTAASIVRWCVLYGQLIFMADAIPADRHSMKESLEKGFNLLVSPGGIAEMYEVNSKQERLHLQERQGIIRLAMETGARLAPVYCFGHSQAYRLTWGARFLQPVARLFRTAIIPFYGRFGLPVGFKVPLLFAIGRPLQIPQVDKPTAAEVSSAHQQLMGEVQRIFDTYKGLYGWQGKNLEIL
ncbi:hypothetical protein Esti_006444 [Eimeria stiedai]